MFNQENHVNSSCLSSKSKKRTPANFIITSLVFLHKSFPVWNVEKRSYQKLSGRKKSSVFHVSIPEGKNSGGPVEKHPSRNLLHPWIWLILLEGYLYRIIPAAFFSAVFSRGKKKLWAGNIPVSLGSISVAIQIEKASHFDLLAWSLEKKRYNLIISPKWRFIIVESTKIT